MLDNLVQDEELVLKELEVSLEDLDHQHLHQSAEEAVGLVVVLLEEHEDEAHQEVHPLAVGHDIVVEQVDLQQVEERLPVDRT